ncbi:MAG: hypothetical protein KatS3mg108_0342 [Isosphaeraceae bacterium]|jgi:hypothetical protein|nr:MAG: hypothetical protein KatS3mg108_0342 [Isosphaeraceae bacterium]
MATWARVPSTSRGFWLRGTARGLVLTWALFWIWFNLMSAFSEGPTAHTDARAGHLGLAALIGAVAVLAWRSDLGGGLALIGLTAALAWFFQGLSVPVAATLLLTPATAGVLLLLAIARERSLQ